MLCSAIDGDPKQGETSNKLSPDAARIYGPASFLQPQYEIQILVVIAVATPDLRFHTSRGGGNCSFSHEAARRDWAMYSFFGTVGFSGHTVILTISIDA